MTKIDNNNVDLELTHYEVGANRSEIGSGTELEMSDRNWMSDRRWNGAGTDME